MKPSLGPDVAWERCDEAFVEALAKDLREMAPQALKAATIRAARRARLPFYRDHQMVAVDLHGAADVDEALLLHGKSGVHWLDGSTRGIDVVDALESLSLTESTVLDYLRFHLYVKRGDHGAFVLIESADDLRLAKPARKVGAADTKARAEALAQLRRHWRPLRILEGDPGSSFRIAATMAYARGLFAATFSIDRDGSVAMTDDEPLADLDGFELPSAGPLHPEPLDRPPPHLTKPAFLANAASGGAEAAAPAVPGSDRDVTRVFVGVLLAEAVRASLGHRLLQRFNLSSQAADPVAQLARFARDFAPIIVIESEIPFVEDIVVDLIDPGRATFPEERTQRSAAVSGDDTRCWVDVARAGTRLHLVSFHAYRRLWDAEWTAHQLAVGEPAALIGCERRSDVPEPLRRVADLFLTLPRIDEGLFAEIFRRVLGASPPRRGRDGGDWFRYLLHTDFHAPLRLKLDPSEAMAYLRERCQARLAEVSASGSLRLRDLHGMGEAREVAEDLIADIAGARAGRIPWSAVDRGLLLVGAPGTGKTTLARAIAQACDVKFVLASAAQWQSAGALDEHLRAIRATFAEARRYAPSILFLDEIDSIGNRETFTGSNAIYQTEVVNGVLEQMQGMDPDEPVIVIGATNLLEKVDPALRRAGRLDQVVTLPRPNVAALEQIFAHYLASHRKQRNVARGVRLATLARLAFGLTGADVELFVRGAARRARKAGRKITQADLVDEVTRRPRRPDSVVRLTPDAMRRVATHEAGHALAALGTSSDGVELTFVSIVPRMDGSLGFTASLPAEGAILTRADVLDRLRTILAGRAAEEVVYGPEDISLNSGGGESSDLAVATRLATRVICTSGYATDGSLYWSSSPDAAQLEQVGQLLRTAYQSALELLRGQRKSLDRLRTALVRHQELDGVAVRRLLGIG